MLQITNSVTSRSSVEYLFHRDFTSVTCFPFSEICFKKKKSRTDLSLADSIFLVRSFFRPFSSPPSPSNRSASPINLISAPPLYDATGYERNPSVRSTREASPVYFRNKIILSHARQKYGLSIFFSRLKGYTKNKNLDKDEMQNRTACDIAGV